MNDLNPPLCLNFGSNRMFFRLSLFILIVATITASKMQDKTPMMMLFSSASQIVSPSPRTRTAFSALSDGPLSARKTTTPSLTLSGMSVPCGHRPQPPHSFALMSREEPKALHANDQKPDQHHGNPRHKSPIVCQLLPLICTNPLRLQLDDIKPKGA